MKIKGLTIAVCLLFLFTGLVVKGQSGGLSRTAISRISLINTAGKKEQLSPTGLIVVVLLSPDCPLCRNYMSTLNQLQKKTPSIHYYGIIPGGMYSTTLIAKFQQDYQATFKLLIDQKKKLTHSLKGTTTPESLLIDEMGRIVYRGLIDNWAVSLGQQRRVITENYLEQAITQTLNHQPVTLSRTKPVGCLVNDL